MQGAVAAISSRGKLLTLAILQWAEEDGSQKKSPLEETIIISVSITSTLSLVGQVWNVTPHRFAASNFRSQLQDASASLGHTDWDTPITTGFMYV